MTSSTVVKHLRRPFKRSLGLRVAALLAAVLMISALAPVNAGQGLSTKFAEVEVKNLKIGLTYSLQRLVNLPLRVENTGDQSLDLKVTPMVPSGGETKSGFEPLPDAHWIRVEFSTFTVFPHMSGATDVIITIPNDEKLLGRRFVGFILTESQNKAFIGVALKSRLLISVSSQKPSEEELKTKFVVKNLGNLNFSFAPMEVLADAEIPVGKRVKLKDHKVEMKLVNPNEKGFHFRLSSVGPWETIINVPAGYQGAPDPKWLTVKNPIVKGEAYSFTPMDMEVEIPDDPRWRGQGFMFLVRAEILEQEVPVYAYAKILVHTAK